jgi:hypothetical protein
MHYRNFSINSNSSSLERLDGEVIIISFTTGQFYSAKGSGADVLSLLREGFSSENIVQILSNHYPSFEYEHSGLDQFISSLLDAGIIHETTANKDTTAFKLPDDLSRSLWDKPELLIHDEIHGLLLVDPIHDTNDEGWPKLKNE